MLRECNEHKEIIFTYRTVQWINNYQIKGNIH